MTDWARTFRVTYPDGDVGHGVQFPSGRCVLDHPNVGLVGATSFEHLGLPTGVALDVDVHIEWADGGSEVPGHG